MKTPARPVPSAAPAARSRSGRPDGRRPLLLALGASVLLHAVLLLVVRFQSPGGDPQTPSAAAPPWAGAATEVVELRMVEVDPALPATPRRPTPTVDVTLPDFPSPRRADLPVPAPAETPPRSVRERLSATEEAARLAAPPRAVLDPRRPLRTLEDEVATLAYELGIYNDSILADWARAARATDWTITDAEGGRWGISPGQLHLGKLTLPLPIGFAPSQEVLARTEAFMAIQRQASSAAARATLEERGKAVRARTDAARRGGGGGGNGGG